MPGLTRGGIPLLLWAIFLVGIITSCGDDKNPAKPVPPTSAGGNVSKAPIVGATVNIYKINTDGSIGAFVAGPFTTDAGGNWSGTIPVGSPGPYVMVSTGGTYTDEATGNPVTVAPGQELHGYFQSGSCAVTPLTDATFSAIQALVGGGTGLTTAINGATTSSVVAFGFSFTTTTPSDAPTATAHQKEYAALLGGLSKLLHGNLALTDFAGTPQVDLVIALAKDMADGKLDGLDAFGATILVPTNATGTTTDSLPALSSTNLSAWLTEANAYAASQPDLRGISFNTSLAWNPAAPGYPGARHSLQSAEGAIRYIRGRVHFGSAPLFSDVRGWFGHKKGTRGGSSPSPRRRPTTVLRRASAVPRFRLYRKTAAEVPAAR